MFGFNRNRSRSRGTRAPVGFIVLIIVGVYAYEEVEKFEQRRDAWQGTVERTYQKRTFTSRRGPERHFIDVRGDDGQTHTARVWSSARWKTVRTGDWVTKKAGSLDPE